MNSLIFPLSKKEAEKSGQPYDSKINKSALFPRRLLELRTKKGITQQKLAADIGVTKSTISLYEQGDNVPDIKTFVKIADYYNVSYDYLLGASDATQRENIDIAENTGLDDKAIKTLKKAKEALLSDKDTERILAKLKIIIINYLLNDSIETHSFFRSIGFYIKYRLGTNKIAPAVLEYLVIEDSLDAEKAKPMSKSLEKRLKKDRVLKESIEEEGFTVDAIAALDERTIKFDEWSMLDDVKKVILKMTEDLFFNPQNDELFGEDVRILKELEEIINTYEYEEC